jgi:hypothetical protein
MEKWLSVETSRRLMKGRLQDYESVSPRRKNKLSVGGGFMEGMKKRYD